MSGQAWKYSDQLDDMDLKMMKRDFFTYKIGMDYYGFSIRPLMRIAREAGAFYKIGKIVLINRERFDAYPVCDGVFTKKHNTGEEYQKILVGSII